MTHRRFTLAALLSASLAMLQACGSGGNPDLDLDQYGQLPITGQDEFLTEVWGSESRLRGFSYGLETTPEHLYFWALREPGYDEDLVLRDVELTVDEVDLDTGETRRWETPFTRLEVEQSEDARSGFMTGSRGATVAIRAQARLEDVNGIQVMIPAGVEFAWSIDGASWTRTRGPADLEDFPEVFYVDDAGRILARDGRSWFAYDGTSWRTAVLAARDGLLIREEYGHAITGFDARGVRVVQARAAGLCAAVVPWSSWSSAYLGGQTLDDEVCADVAPVELPAGQLQAYLSADLNGTVDDFQVNYNDTMLHFARGTWTVGGFGGEILFSPGATKVPVRYAGRPGVFARFEAGQFERWLLGIGQDLADYDSSLIISAGGTYAAYWRQTQFQPSTTVTGFRLELPAADTGPSKFAFPACRFDRPPGICEESAAGQCYCYPERFEPFSLSGVTASFVFPGVELDAISPTVKLDGVPQVLDPDPMNASTLLLSWEGLEGEHVIEAEAWPQFAPVRRTFSLEREEMRDLGRFVLSRGLEMGPTSADPEDLDVVGLPGSGDLIVRSGSSGYAYSEGGMNVDMGQRAIRFDVSEDDDWIRVHPQGLGALVRGADGWSLWSTAAHDIVLEQIDFDPAADTVQFAPRESGALILDGDGASATRLYWRNSGFERSASLMFGPGAVMCDAGNHVAEVRGEELVLVDADNGGAVIGRVVVAPEVEVIACSVQYILTTEAHLTRLYTRQVDTTVLAPDDLPVVGVEAALFESPRRRAYILHRSSADAPTPDTLSAIDPGGVLTQVAQSMEGFGTWESGGHWALTQDHVMLRDADEVLAVDKGSARARRIRIAGERAAVLGDGVGAVWTGCARHGVPCEVSVFDAPQELDFDYAPTRNRGRYRSQRFAGFTWDGMTLSFGGDPPSPLTLPLQAPKQVVSEAQTGDMVGLFEGQGLPWHIYDPCLIYWRTAPSGETTIFCSR